MNKFLLFTLAIVISSCSSPDKTERKLEEQVTVDFAKNFEFEIVNGETILHILNPKDSLPSSFYPADINSTRIISLSSTTNGMIALLNQHNTVIGVSNKQFLYDSIFIKNFNQGLIEEFGEETNHSLEKVIKSRATHILYSGFNSKFPNEEKLKKLGISAIPIYDWRETHPLGKAEWIKVIGFLTGHLNEANSYFEQVKTAYINLTQNTSYAGKPTVLAGNIFNDIWYAPAANSYMGILFSDAGADYVYKNDSLTGTASLQFSFEKILMDNQTTEYWINPGKKDREALLIQNPKIKHLSILNNAFTYSNKQNKYWELSASQPHLLLEDLISIFHDEPVNESKLNFYSKIK